MSIYLQQPISWHSNNKTINLAFFKQLNVLVVSAVLSYA